MPKNKCYYLARQFICLISQVLCIGKLADTSKYLHFIPHLQIIIQFKDLFTNERDFCSNSNKIYLIKYWNPVAAVIAAGLISAYYFGVTGTYWAVTGEFTRWGGHALQALGVDISDWSYYKIIGMQGTIFTRIDGVMILGMFAGCISAALWANNVKWRNQPHKRRIVQALIGGALAGFGARLAMGCNLASLFTGIPQFSVHAWFFTIATAIGTYAGVKVTLLPMFRVKLELKKGAAKLQETDPKQANRRFWIGMVVFFAYLIASLYVMTNSIKLGFAMLCGLAFGLLIERAQICFTSAFRDLWVTGRAYMAKAIIFGIIVGTLGVFSYIQLGVPPNHVGRSKCDYRWFIIWLRYCISGRM